MASVLKDNYEGMSADETAIVALLLKAGQVMFHAVCVLVELIFTGSPVCVLVP